MAEALTGVYSIFNRANGKQYVGSAADSFKKRWGEHRSQLNNDCHYNHHLQRAWNKYGSESFEFRVIEYCHPENCLNREQYWLDTLMVFDQAKGYNLCPTAGSRLGTRHSEETKAKLSKITKEQAKSETGQYSHEHMLRMNKRAQTPEARARQVAALKNIEWTEERRANHREAVNKPERMEKVKKALRGQRRSVGEKAAMSMAKKASALRRKKLLQVEVECSAQ